MYGPSVGERDWDKRYPVFHRGSLAPLALLISVWVVWPAQAFARAVVRFIHAVPGVGTATVSVDGAPVGSVAFGQSTRWHSIRSGTFRWVLRGGGRTLATGTATVGGGAYDVVILQKQSRVFLGIYKVQAGRGGASRIRVIHAAPELGSPALSLDGKQVVQSLAYTQATPYLSPAPGPHTLSAMRPGTSSALAQARMHLSPGDAYSAVVIGTRGQMVRVVTLTDRGAPLTRPAPTPAATKSRSSSGGSAAAGASASCGGSLSAGARTNSGTFSGSTYVVQAGDCLWMIARRIVGPTGSDAAVEQKVEALWSMNAARIGTGDPNLIFPGTRLTLA